MNKFDAVCIGGIGDVVTGKTPKTDNPDYAGNDYMFIGPSDLHKHFFITDSEKTISEAGLASLGNNTIDGVSVLVGCIGWDLGNVGIVDGKCATNQQINAITSIKNDYNPLYAYYWLKTKKDFLFQNASVTRTPILNKTTFSELRINFPKDRREQDRIVEVLSTLDAKIDLNRRLNAELEAMAKLLYDYWFVQFDFPISAAQAAAMGRPDLEGKPYRASGGKMVYQPEMKREIPEGWEVGNLGRLCSMKRGVTYGKSDIRSAADPDAIPILRATNVTNGILDVDDLVYVDRKLVKEDQILQRNENIVVMSSGSKEHVGKSAPMFLNCRLGFGAFCSKVSAQPSSTNFIAIYLQSERYKRIIKNVCLGTNINNLTDDHILSQILAIPPATVLARFDQIIEPTYESIGNNHRQSQELTQLRDWLLPMLMNGQVTVSDPAATQEG